MSTGFKCIGLQCNGNLHATFQTEDGVKHTGLVGACTAGIEPNGAYRRLGGDGKFIFEQEKIIDYIWKNKPFYVYAAAAVAVACTAAIIATATLVPFLLAILAIEIGLVGLPTICLLGYMHGPQMIFNKILSSMNHQEQIRFLQQYAPSEPGNGIDCMVSDKKAQLQFLFAVNEDKTVVKNHILYYAAESKDRDSRGITSTIAYSDLKNLLETTVLKALITEGSEHYDEVFAERFRQTNSALRQPQEPVRTPSIYPQVPPRGVSLHLG